MQSTRHSCQISVKLKFSIQIFEKIVKFHENSSSGSRVFSFSMRTGGQTDRHDKVHSRFSQFCEHIRKALHHFTSRVIEVLRTKLTSRSFSLICRPSSVLVRSIFQHFTTSFNTNVSPYILARNVVRKVIFKRVRKIA